MVGKTVGVAVPPVVDKAANVRKMRSEPLISWMNRVQRAAAEHVKP